MSIEINKGKLLKNDIVEVSFIKQNLKKGSKPAKCNEEHADPPHPDLRKAFKSLNIHAAMIGEFVSPMKVKDIEDVDEELAQDFSVTGFTLVGDDLEAGVILSARKTLKTGKTMGFNTPIQHFEDPADNPYPFCDNLLECISKCKSELKQYLEGKFAPNPQLDMFPKDEKEPADDDSQEHLVVKEKKQMPIVSRIDEGTDVKPKRGRKVKKVEDENF